MESREAELEALTDYTGAVILVSHDMHLLNLVADRLWLVKDGRVAPYEDDLEAYRRSLLAAEATDAARPAPTSATQRPAREALQALRAEVRKAEERVAKIEEMRAKLADKLADPALYEAGRVGDLEVWQRKYAEIEDGLARAEALWLDAQERLEAAGSGA